MWTVPSLNHFYEAKTDSILLIPAFAAEIPHDAEPKLDEEHTTWKWMRYEECKTAIMWPEQKRLLGIIEQIVTSNQIDRKSTRLNSSHVAISYAVFCLKKKKEII